ncbi:hypothetical protein SALBM217S_07711 [Streptomyces griseoloalbus]
MGVRGAAVGGLRSALSLSAGRLPAVRRRHGAGGALRRGTLVGADRGGRCLTGAVALGGAGRGRLDGADEALGDGLVDAGRELRGLGQPLVGEEFGQSARVALADGAHLPGALPPVQLQRDDGRLQVQAGDGVAGDLGAVQAGDGDEGGRHGSEAGRPGAGVRGGQGEQHADAVDGVGHGVQVDREPVVGGRLARHLQAGLHGGARMGHPLRAVDPSVLVAECGGGRDRCAGRDPDLQTGLGQRVVLPPHQLGRHRVGPPVSRRCVGCAEPAPARGPVRPRLPQRTGRMAGIRSWKVRPLAGLPRAVIVQPAPVRCTLAMIWAV